jgi:uncharacterized protein with von Willebrand factor type A (vWA) domain
MQCLYHLTFQIFFTILSIFPFYILLICTRFQKKAGANKIRGSVRAATESALKDAKDISEAIDGWGLGAGELQKMPIEQKLELAKRLQTKKFKLMAQVIGRMQRLAVHKQKTKLNQSRDEIHNVGIGNDLSRVLPIELVQLRHDLESRV